MKLAVLAAAMIIGGGLSLMAPKAEAAMPQAQAPVDVTQTTDVQQVHGRHCRIRRGHRSRCRRYRPRRGYRHCHRGYCHRHRGGHRRYRRHYRPGFSIRIY